jgi:hypothetical protein
MGGGMINFQEETIFILSAESSAHTHNPQSVVNTHVSRFAAQSRHKAKKERALLQSQEAGFQAPSRSIRKSGTENISRPKKSSLVPLGLMGHTSDTIFATQQGDFVLRHKAQRWLDWKHGERLMRNSSNLLRFCTCVDCQPDTTTSSPVSFRFSSPPECPSPPNWIGSADPFDNFPIKLDYNGRLLLNHCKSSVPTKLNHCQAHVCSEIRSVEFITDQRPKFDRSI